MTDITKRLAGAQAGTNDETIRDLRHAAGVANQLIAAAVETTRKDGEVLARQANMLEKQANELAAQSAELERVRKLPDIWRKRYENDSRRTDADVCADELEIALAAPSAAGGYKEPSEAQMFGGDLYSGIKP